jgi:hypothetical protein
MRTLEYGVITILLVAICYIAFVPLADAIGSSMNNATAAIEP